MSKKPSKKAATGTAEAKDAPKKRSKLKLAILALVPLVLAGGGYAGWTVFADGTDVEEAHAGEGEVSDGVAGHGADAVQTTAIPTEIAAETSFSYSFALSEILKPRCGAMGVAALDAAAAEEAHGDGALAHYSWIAANRRAGTVTEKSCGYVMSEIAAADARAEGGKAAPAKDAKAEAHH